MEKEYYEQHAKEYIDSTMNVDMSNEYQLFEKYLPQKAVILDIGFGSGRDSLYFSKKYEVTSIDPTPAFVEHAKELGLTNVILTSIQEIDYESKFDGIWACASLLHVRKRELSDVFLKCSRALKDNGVMYCSFKKGSFDGIRNGRHFTDLETDELRFFLPTNMCIVDSFETVDHRPNRMDHWINYLIKLI